MAYFRSSAQHYNTDHLSSSVSRFRISPVAMHDPEASSSRNNNNADTGYEMGSPPATPVYSGANDTSISLNHQVNATPNQRGAAPTQHNKSNKPLILFSINFTNYNPIFLYVFLIGGLILFMCLYGYYQVRY